MSEYPTPDGKVTEFVDVSLEENSPDDGTKTNAVSPAVDGGDANFSSPTHTQILTLELEQESSTQIKNLAKTILDVFPDYGPEDMEIEPMNGGAYNHIVGITLRKVPPNFPWYAFKSIRNMIKLCFTGRQEPQVKPKHLILRVPRYRTQDMYHQVTILNYLKHRLAYPVPEVVVIDSTPHNTLGKPYMLQQRLPGRPLDELWPMLNHAQRLSSIRAISTLLLDLRKIRNKCPGLISIRNTTYDLKQDLIRTEPIPIPSSSRTAVASDLSGPQTTKAFLLDLCTRQHIHTSASSPPACHALWPRITEMIHKLHDLGLISDSDPFYLYHGDMRPQNLLVELVSNTKVRISGILDWDSALFAPAFMSMQAPFFAWGNGEDERGALVEPRDDEARELKKVFESVVGDEFVKGAYRVELVLARRLWGVLTKGVTCGDDVWLVEDVLEEFAKMHPLG